MNIRIAVPPSHKDTTEQLLRETLPTVTLVQPPELVVGASASPELFIDALGEHPEASALLLLHAPLPDLKAEVVSALASRNFCIVPNGHPRLEACVRQFLNETPPSLPPNTPVELELHSRNGKKTLTKALEDYVLTTGIRSEIYPAPTFARLSTVVLEELLLNAIMANPALKGCPRNSPFQLPVDSPIRARWNAFGDSVHLSVEDPFGALHAAPAMRSLCGNRDGELGGVGLRFVFSRCEHLGFQVESGRRTVVSCVLSPHSHKMASTISFRRI